MVNTSPTSIAELVKFTCVIFIALGVATWLWKLGDRWKIKKT